MAGKIPDAAAALEFHEDWELTLTATRYELEVLKQTSIERALLRMVITRSDRVAVQALYRMRSNRLAALNGDYLVGFENPVPACGALDTNGTLAEQDIAAWRNAMACRLPQSTGSVTRLNDEFTITILWDDSQGIEPPLQFRFTTRL